jgi:hypothetical protein
LFGAISERKKNDYKVWNWAFHVQAARRHIPQPADQVIQLLFSHLALVLHTHYSRPKGAAQTKDSVQPPEGSFAPVLRDGAVLSSDSSD